MAHFFVGHFVEDFCRGGILLAQSLRERAIDAAIFLFVGNGQRQNLLFAKISETHHIDLGRAITVNVIGKGPLFGKVLNS